jgi:flagellar basal-body rod modification protein FlgD
MDVTSMMNALDTKHSASRVASGLVHAGTAGRSTAPTATPVFSTAKSTSASAAATGAAASTSASAAGDITSNDFLTLLVTEMQNQDPTQPTDPNAYIQQLVGVNSLQQLISINSELGGASSSSSASSSIAPIGTNGTATSAIAAANTPSTNNLFGAPGSQTQGS